MIYGVVGFFLHHLYKLLQIQGEEIFLCSGLETLSKSSHGLREDTSSLQMTFTDISFLTRYALHSHIYPTL